MDTNPPVATARAIGYNRLPMSRLSRDRFGLALRLSLLLLALTACGEATPTPFPTVERAAGGGPARTATPPPMQANERAGNDNIREGRVGGVMGAPGATGGQG